MWSVDGDVPYGAVAQPVYVRGLQHGLPLKLLQ